MKTFAIAILGLVIGATAMTTVVEASRTSPADDHGVLIAQAETPATAPAADPGTVKLIEAHVDSPADAGSATASGSAVTTPAPAVPTVESPKIEDASLLMKLWKSGTFLGVGILAVYIGLFAWVKLDKKHAFYAATALAGVGVLVESLRKGDTPNVQMMTATLLPTIAILIAGPNHVAAPQATKA